MLRCRARWMPTLPRGLKLFVAVAACFGSSAAAHAASIATINAGSTGSSIASSAPGTPVTLDFRTVGGVPTAAQPPVRPLELILTFQLSQPPTAFKVQIASGEVFSVPVLTSTQGAFDWYDPSTIDPALIQMPKDVMPPSLVSELQDGQLNAHIWAEGTTITGSFYLFQAQLTVITPEPMAGSCVAGFALIGLRRRRV
ncbi:MAG: hypothetical protein QM770_20510 [Tepidisphaeraceae bacterium]